MDTGVIAEETRLNQRTAGNSTVSVIIPNYNHSPYLVQRIESVLNQTFRDFEVIILDDCSTDNSLEIIESYRANPKVSKIIINDVNGGSTFLQWKKGIESAKGDWIWIAESDDWSEPSFLETLLKDVDSEISFAFCQSIVVDQHNKILWQTNHRKLTEKIQGKDFFKRHWRENLIMNASMAIFRRENYDKIKKYFLEWKYIGDWVFWIEMSFTGKVLISGKKLNYFRKHSLDIQSKAVKLGAWHFEKLDIIPQFREMGIINEKEQAASYKREFINFLAYRKAIDPLKRKELYTRFKSVAGPGIYRYQLAFAFRNIFQRIKARARRKST